MRPNEGSVDHVSVDIDAKLKGLVPMSPECCIFKVNYQLRSVNEKAYEPQMLAVGPYHRGKDRLQGIEEHKLRYLKQLLERRNESSVETYVMALRRLEERARKCYAESISLSIDEFVQMMLLDGCFIIELFRKYAMVEPGDASDPILNLEWIRAYLVRDLMLFENQLPFFVLCQLFNMTVAPNAHYNLIDLALHFFGSPLPCPGSVQEFMGNSTNEIKHILGLVHTSMLASLEHRGSTRDIVGNKKNWGFIPCATELQEAGVKFKRVDGHNLFDIKFKNGIMEIPFLRVEDQTESLLRNLIAYEQYRQGHNLNYITDYVTFMDCLINSSKDVELLCRYRIIENWLGDHEVVSTMFNKLGDNVAVSNFFYAEIFNDVNMYYCRQWNIWMAKLRHNYFNSPWALLSFLAAVLLLLLTLTQTIFSILSYFQ